MIVVTPKGRIRWSQLSTIHGCLSFEVHFAVNDNADSYVFIQINVFNQFHDESFKLMTGLINKIKSNLIKHRVFGLEFWLRVSESSNHWTTSPIVCVHGCECAWKREREGESVLVSVRVHESVWCVQVCYCSSASDWTGPMGTLLWGYDLGGFYLPCTYYMHAERILY